jgi:hypothetical protein
MKRKGDLPTTKAKPAKAKPPSATTDTAATDTAADVVYDEDLDEREGDRAEESLSSVSQTHADLEMLLARRNAPTQRRGSGASKPKKTSTTSNPKPLLQKPKLPGGAVAAAARTRRDERKSRQTDTHTPASITTPEPYKPPAVLKAKPEMKPKAELKPKPQLKAKPDESG